MRSSCEVRKNQSHLGSPSGTKSKKLAAICEEEYKKNHGESKEIGGGSGLVCADSELRRSSRVRKIPSILDASPPPPKKRKRFNNHGDRSSSSLGRVAKEENVDLDNPDDWNIQVEVKEEECWFSREWETERCGPVDVKESESSEDGEKESDTSNAEDESASESEDSMQVDSETRERDEKKKATKRSVVLESENEAEVDATDTESEDGTNSTDNEIDDSDEERESETQGSAEETGSETEANVDEMRADTNVTMEAVQNESRNQMEGLENEVEMIVEEIENKEMGVMVPESGNGTGILENGSDFSNKVKNRKGDTLPPEILREASIEVNESLKQNNDIGEEDASRAPSNDKTKEHNEFLDRGVESVEMLDELPIRNEPSNKVVDSIRTSSDRLGKPLFKQTRRCGLCGVGTDGRPPKKLMQDNGDSDIEAHSGSSSSEEPNYDILDGFGDDPGWLGRLLGPINDRYGISGTWVHQNCAVWSPEVYFAGVGCLKNIRAALFRGRSLKCTRCARPGATIGCRVDRCPRTYHLPCARANGCIFDHRKFLIACTDHRHHFQPHGRQCQVRMKKLKVKRMQMEMKKHSNDAWRKDVEAEEKWFEKCGEDEEFLKRESKRLHRDLFRVAPEYIGGSDSESGKTFEGWDSVAGLEGVTQCMKEVVLLPLLYPEFFDNLGLTPPRGILLHGHPGTGKTLVVRALIGSLARGNRRIAYFARKGADCLGKYVGDAERQLRLLFQVAEKCQPSIIFFDEIDGLAPKRSRQQDQTHSSVVSTLLALLDGLKSRGSVVVIGATNYPDAIDPALRRPGRFDREIYFPLPSVDDRAAIISLHTRKWPKSVSGYLLKWIAKETAGFAGADIQALCTQAAMIALNRSFPLQESLAAAELGVSSSNRAALPSFSVEERDWLEALSRSPPPCSRRGAGIAASDIFSSPLPTYLVPSLLLPLCSLLVAFHLEERILLPPLLSKAAVDVQNVICSALSDKKITEDCWWSYVETLLQEVDVVKDIANRLSYAGILDGGFDLVRSVASIPGTGDCSLGSTQFMVHRVCRHPGLLGNASLESLSKSGFQLLIAGGPKSGQRHLASCILHCFIGNAEMQKIDTATISQEGNGDLVLGITHLLIKCASRKSCVVFMPRIDLWAVETETPLNEEVDCDDDSVKETSSPIFPETVEKKALQNAARVSHAWNTFFEQVESLRVSTKMIILATSGMPYKLLPPKIQQFFKTDLSKEYQPTMSEAVPQFTVQVVENSDQDMAIDLSATELSRRAIQVFLHLVHQGSHTHCDLRKKYKIEDPDQGYGDAAYQNNTGCGTGEDAGIKSKPLDDGSLKVPPLPININVKAKSSLQLAVSTFGYQILRYPQFAELCWLTSKLKEGPSADVSGPWRGWPFNSCITRPCNSSEQTITASDSNNAKGKGSSGIVRGLMAVGLSAYRGTYISLREVTFEVRKVLELLVGRINVKLNAGKDRCRYIRILSQVAYLEDLVNSWVYAMRSFESTTQTESLNPLSCSVVNPSVRNESTEQGAWNEPIEEGISDRTKGSEEDTQNMNCPDPIASSNLTDIHQSVVEIETNHEAFLEDTGPLTTLSTDGLTLVKENVDVNSNTEMMIEDSDVSSFRQAVLLDLNSPAADHEQNETHHGSCEVETTATAIVNSLNNPNGSGESNSISWEDPHKSADSCNGTKALDGVHGSESANNMPEPVKQVEPTARTSPLDEPSLVCLYRCCPQCISIIQDSMHKLVTRELRLGGSYITTEGIHDAVSSLSVKLIAAVRKFISAKDNGTIKQEAKVEDHDECPEKEECSCKSLSGNLLAPGECCSHSAKEQGSSGEGNTYPSPKTWLKPLFIFKDGILVPVGTEDNNAMHCKYDSFCLGSLIELIATEMKPFD
ncbi:ATPase family AAA domain-containing protein [Cardamine amara subsp. amara]|uniref:ATPase family AAA domain-containing protein n=1 Tax=Cardamine amara subsp. amara TaxID=228776 RepID=A0ABD1A6L1_CARAN